MYLMEQVTSSLDNIYSKRCINSCYIRVVIISHSVTYVMRCNAICALSIQFNAAGVSKYTGCSTICDTVSLRNESRTSKRIFSNLLSVFRLRFVETIIASYKRKKFELGIDSRLHRNEVSPRKNFTLRIDFIFERGIAALLIARRNAG